MSVTRVLIYARISVSAEESVSIARQLDSARKYADARDWAVIGEFLDDGVSASKNKPEDRVGWRQVLDFPETFDKVIIWKVDRLARRTLDFLNANESLKARGAGLVAVEDHIDMTTDQGEGFATILAVFGQMEARAISARVTASRRHLRAEGRVVGGRLPYGWMSEKRGPGRYLVKNPDTIGYVETAAQMVLGGQTVKAVCTWLESVNAALPPSASRRTTRWNHSTVSGLLRNPALAGMTLDNPGNDAKQRGAHVRRGDDGMPIVNAETAILTTTEYRQLVAALDSREQPFGPSSRTSPFFSRLATCGHCDTLMHRTRKRDRESLACPACNQVVATRQLRLLLVGRLLMERGDQLVWEHDRTSVPVNDLELADIEASLRYLTTRLVDEDADMLSLVSQIEALKARRKEARSAPARQSWRTTSRTVRQTWDGAKDEVERRDVLVGQMESLRIVRGGVGRNLDPARVRIAWAPIPIGVPLPDGTRMMESLDEVPSGDGTVGPIVVRLSDGVLLTVE